MGKSLPEIPQEMTDPLDLAEVYAARSVCYADEAVRCSRIAQRLSCASVALAVVAFALAILGR